MTKRAEKDTGKVKRPKRSVKDLGVPKDAAVKGGFGDIVVEKPQDKGSHR